VPAKMLKKEGSCSLGVALFIKNSPDYYYCGLIQQTKKWKVKQCISHILLILRNTIETCCLFIIGGYTAKKILPISKILVKYNL
jgi:hypothetical protein